MVGGGTVGQFVRAGEHQVGGEDDDQHRTGLTLNVKGSR